MNDSSWRSLSAILGLACVILIIAAGALLMTSPGATASPSGAAPGSGNPSGTSSTGPVTPSGSGTTPGAKTPKPSVTPIPKAPIAQITFSNLRLDATTDTKATPRTFTFVTDGTGPVGITILKYSTATIRVCAKVDDSAWDCRKGGKISYAGAFTDTAHSVWTVTLLGVTSSTPTVDVAFSWPTNAASITLTHGRFQGSSSPGVPEALNGFTATFKSRAAGNMGLSASWTVIKADAAVTLSDVTSTPAVNTDEKHYASIGDLGAPAYGYTLSASRFYKISLRDLSADSYRPDLRAVITFP